MDKKYTIAGVTVAVLLMVAGVAGIVLLDNPSLSGLNGGDQSTTPGPGQNDTTNPPPSQGSNGTTPPPANGQNNTTTPPPAPVPPPTQGNNSTTNPPPSPPPAPVQKEPKLWMEYTTSWTGDSIYYGMPTPWSNRFTFETNKYGEDQPSGPVRITHFIHISDITPRSGNIGPAENSVEIRTYNYDSSVPRLVNLYSDGKGGCYGILVDTYATWDYTWTFENGKTEKFTQTFSVNITKLGSHTIDIYAVHDHGDGTAVDVSNHLTRTFVTNANSLFNGGYGYTNYYQRTWTPMTFTATTESYQSAIHGPLPYPYTGKVVAKLFLPNGVTADISGLPASSGASYTGTFKEMSGRYIDLGVYNGQGLSVSWDLSFWFYTGYTHDIYLVLEDQATGQLVGYGGYTFWERTR